MSDSEQSNVIDLFRSPAPRISTALAVSPDCQLKLENLRNVHGRRVIDSAFYYAEQMLIQIPLHELTSPEWESFAFDLDGTKFPSLQGYSSIGLKVNKNPEKTPTGYKFTLLEVVLYKSLL